MATVDGREYTRHETRLADTCVHCDARGVTLRGGDLLCITHTHHLALAKVAALFAGPEPVSA